MLYCTSRWTWPSRAFLWHLQVRKLTSKTTWNKLFQTTLKHKKLLVTWLIFLTKFKIKKAKPRYLKQRQRNIKSEIFVQEHRLINPSVLLCRPRIQQKHYRHQVFWHRSWNHQTLPYKLEKCNKSPKVLYNKQYYHPKLETTICKPKKYFLINCFM